MFYWIPIIYISVAVIIYIADGWFEISNGEGEDAAHLAACWPFILIVYPFFLIFSAREALKDLRRKKQIQEKDKEKIRIAAEKEEELLIEQIDSELKHYK